MELQLKNQVKNHTKIHQNGSQIGPRVFCFLVLGACWEVSGRVWRPTWLKMVSRLQKSKFWSSLGGNHGDQNRWKTILKKYFKCFYELFFQTIWNKQVGILTQHESNLRSTWINLRIDCGQLEATWNQLEAIQNI